MAAATSRHFLTCEPTQSTQRMVVRIGFAAEAGRSCTAFPLEDVMMKRDLRCSRRNMIQAIGAGAALLPLLESDKADAACLVGGIKRMYIFCWPNGMLSSINTWATKGADPTSWQLAPFQTNAGNLTALMPELLLLEGVDYKAIKDMPGSGERTGHACYPVMLTGAYYQTLSTSTSADIAGGISVDQYVGSALKAAGYGGITSLNLASFAQSGG